MTELYVVLKAVDSVLIYGQLEKLPEGEFVIPAFLDEEKAKEYTNDGKYQITVMEI